MVLSLVTMAGSAYVFWRYDQRLNKQNIRINEFTIKEQKEKEDSAKKAIIEVSHECRGGSGDLIIMNTGNSDARNLQMEIDEKDDSGIYWRRGNFFPYRCLTPGASVRILYSLDSGYQKDPILTFKWEDDFGNNRNIRHSVFLG